MENSYVKNAIEIKKQLENYKKISELVDFLGGIEVKIEPSDKNGYNFEKYYVNNIFIKQIYIKE